MCKIVLPELRQILANFDNFRGTDGKKDKIIWGALIFHFPYFASTQYARKGKVKHLQTKSSGYGLGTAGRVTFGAVSTTLHSQQSARLPQLAYI